jgi:PAB1-binding protein PBP1
MGIAIFVGLLFFVIGIVILISGVVSVFKTRSRVANSLSADGVVTAFATGMGKSGYLYYPLVQFRIPSEQLISFQSSVGSSRGGYSVGQQVKVLYDARKPQEAEIDALSSLWLVPGCMLAMGLAFTIGGLFLSVVMTLVMINQS